MPGSRPVTGSGPVQPSPAGVVLCIDGRNVGYDIDGAFSEMFRIPARAVEANNVRRRNE